jgi:predicted MFS family arabinose efflux permease
VAAAAPNALVLPGASGDTGGDGEGGPSRRPGWGWLLRAEARPLFAVALAFGVVTAFYFSFAVDLVSRSGGLSREAAGPVLYSIVGASGLVGLLTGEAVSRFGLGQMLRAALASVGAASFLAGVAPSSVPSVVLSACLFGAGVMVMSAILSIWSSEAFPEGPSAGFSAALFAFGAGLTAGPVSFGALAAPFGLEAMFVVAAAASGLAALTRPRGAKSGSARP